MPPFLPALAGLLLVVCFPPFPLGPLSFIALVPLAVYVSERESGPGGASEALRGGLWMGTVFFAGLLYWIGFSLPDRPWLGAPAFLISVGLLALFPAGVGWLLHRAMHGWRAPLWLALPFAWTGSEWLRGALPGGFAFPWAGLSLSLTDFPIALDLAAWAGENAASFWIALVNGLVATTVLNARRDDRRAWVPAAAALLVAAAPLAVSRDVNAGDGAAEATELRVAIVQTSVAQEIRADPDAGARAMAAALERLLLTIAPRSIDLVVLPETAFPVALEAPQGSPYLEALQGHAFRLGAPIIVGAFGLGEARSGVRPVYNSVFVVDSAGVRGRYDKRHLVPGVERTPLVPPRWAWALGDTASYAIGEPSLLAVPSGVGALLLGPLVCYESAFGALARRHRSQGARLLVNVTNDAWFGGGLPGRAARAQHEAHLVMRALENRIPVVRSANGGVSMLVDANGASKRVAAAGEEAVRVETLLLGADQAQGNLLAGALGPACLIVALALAFLPKPRG